MIKIVSGWSNPGGSTTAFVNLTNALNSIGLETVFYGPHEYHKSKCNGDNIQNFIPSKNDSVISHFIDLPKLDVKKHIFSCHETDVWPMTYRDLSKYNKVHYVSKWQQEWHGAKKSYFLLPNILEDLKPNTKPNEKIGGVIGSIDRNKRTHLSIQKALEDGCKKVYLFGTVTDNDYFETMKHLICEEVVLVGQVEDKQKMYDMVTDVYQNSIRETWGYVKGESVLTGTNYHSNEATNHFWTMDKLEILERWKKELGV